MHFNINKSLKTKLLLSFFLLSFIPSILVGLLSYEYTYREQRRLTFAKLPGINTSKAQQIGLYLEDQVFRATSISKNTEIQHMIRELTALIGSSSEMSETQFNQEVSAITAKYKQHTHHLLADSGFVGMLILTQSTGEVVYSGEGTGIPIGSRITGTGNSNNHLLELWDSTRMSVKPTIHDFVKSDLHDELLMYISIPIFDEEGVCTDILILELPNKQIELITSLEFGGYKTRESYLINSGNMVVTAPRIPVGNKSVGEVYDDPHIQKVLNQDGFLDVVTSDTENKKIIITASAIHLDDYMDAEVDFEWTIITQMALSELTDPAHREALVILFIILVISAIAVGIGYLIVKQIVTPITLLDEEVTRLAHGYLDFHTDLERQDEIGSLLKNTEYMVERLREVVSSVSTAIDKTNAIGTTITSSVEQQSAISMEQAGSINEISSTMDEFTSSFSQVSENVNAVSEMTDKIFTYTTESSNLIDAVAEKIRDINVDNERNIANIMDLKKRSKDIAKVMEIINNISDQTKIIAFNAALEASSAGEAGKRFGVVAAEIRKLTESVIASTASIDTIITEIQDLADQMVVASEKTTKNIQKGLSFSGESVGNVDFIVSSIKASNEATKQIVLSVQQQQTAVTQIQEGLKELSIGAQQNSEAIQALNETGSEFKQVGRQLSLLIRRFKLQKRSSDSEKRD